MADDKKRKNSHDPAKTEAHKKRNWERMMRKMKHKAEKRGQVFETRFKTYDQFHAASVQGGKDGPVVKARMHREAAAAARAAKAKKGKAEEAPQTASSDD